MNWQDIFWCMDLALEQAEIAFHMDEVPIGAIIRSGSGKILAQSHNLKEANHNPCGHAEVLAIQEAAKTLGNWRLNDCSLFVTLEPCLMCMGAIQQARIKNIFFGAYDGKGGALSLGYNVHTEKRLNHQFQVMGGISHFKSSQILSSFFKQKRSGYKK